MSSAGTLLYSAIARIVTSGYRLRGVEAWPRNSLLTGNVTPFVSDIDLSFAVPGRTDAEVRRIADGYARLRRAIPILGEANFYAPAKEPFILAHANPLELRRDPRFLTRHPHALRALTPALKFVFVARMLGADLGNLRKRPAARRGKWVRHLESCGIAFDPVRFGRAALLETLRKEVFAVASGLPIAGALDELFAATDPDRRFVEICAGPLSNALLLLFPMRWLTENMLGIEDGFSTTMLRIRALSPPEREILLEHARWELAHLCNQFAWAAGPDDLLAHVRRLFLVVRFAAPERYDEILRDFLKTEIFTRSRIEADRRATEISPTFCATPWFGLNVKADGQFLLCAQDTGTLGIDLNRTPLDEAIASPELAAVRRRMLDGAPTDPCRECYRMESEGTVSLRMRNADDYHRAFGPLSPERPGIVRAKLSLGKRCSSQCLLCSIQHSGEAFSAPPPEAYAWHAGEPFRERFRAILPGLREIELCPTDTFSERDHLDLLNACAAPGGASRAKLIYHPHGAFDPAPFLDAWKSFGAVEIWLPLDAVGGRDSYLRYPTDWGGLAARLAQYEGCPDFVSTRLICSLHLLNVYYLPEVAAWIRDQGFKNVNRGREGHVWPEMIDSSELLSIRACPPELKKAVRTRLTEAAASGLLRAKDVHRVLHYMESRDTHHPRTLSALRALDRKRARGIDANVPEIVPYFTS